MTRLVDTSVVVKWFVAEDGQSEAEALIGESLVAPDLLLAEVSNALWKKWRKAEIQIEQMHVALTAVDSFIEILPSRPLADDALAIAVELGHPVYDCYYLAMCAAMELTLVTADRRLMRACDATRFQTMLEVL